MLRTIYGSICKDAKKIWKIEIECMYWKCQLYLIKNAQKFMKNKIIIRFEIGLKVIIDNRSE